MKVRCNSTSIYSNPLDAIMTSELIGFERMDYCNLKAPKLEDYGENKQPCNDRKVECATLAGYNTTYSDGSFVLRHQVCFIFITSYITLINIISHNTNYMPLVTTRVTTLSLRFGCKQKHRIIFHTHICVCVCVCV